MMTFVKYLDACRGWVKARKTKILFASSVTGTILTGVTGVRAGIRIERKRREFEIINGEPTKKDILKIAAPELAPVVISAVTGITCESVMLADLSSRLETVTSAAAALSTQIDKMKAAEKEIVGPEKAKEIEKKALEEPTSTPVESPTGKIWFKDFYTNAEFYTTYEAVAQMIGNGNVRLTWDDLSTNDLYMFLEKADSRDLYSELGDENGWKSGTELKYRYVDGHLANGTPCMVLVVSEKPRILPKRIND